MRNCTVFALLLVFWPGLAFGLGSEHPNDNPISGPGNWPASLKDLVNSTPRVHGFFVNERDELFYAGDTEAFKKFLEAYAKVDGIASHALHIHAGAGKAKSPWDKGEGKQCDWRLSINSTPDMERKPKALEEKKPAAELHLWLGGQVDFDKINVPKGVSVVKEQAR